MKRGSAVAVSVAAGTLIVASLVWATADEREGLPPESEALAVAEPELDSRTGEPVIDDVEAYQPRFVVGGDGLMYPNRPAAVYQPVDRIIEAPSANSTREQARGQVEDQDFFERQSNL